jgi:hypothetical protein
MVYKITKKDIGRDFVDEDGYAEIVEVFGNGNILIEFPNRRRKVITKTKLKEAGLEA